MIVAKLKELSDSRDLRAQQPFDRRPVRVSISITPDGKFLSVKDNKIKDKKGGSSIPIFDVPRPVEYSNKSGAARFLVETLTRVIDPNALRGKHQAFYQNIVDANNVLKSQDLESILAFYRRLTPALTERVRKQAADNGIDETWLTTFEIVQGDEYHQVLENKIILKWWRQQYAQGIRSRYKHCPTGLCLVTGQEDIIPDRHPISVPRLGSLVSVNFDSASFVGCQYAARSRIGLEASQDYGLALDALAKNKLPYKTCNTSNDYIILTWVDPSTPITDTEIDAIFTEFLGNDFTLDQQIVDEQRVVAHQFMQSVLYGHRPLQPLPTDRFFALVVEKRKARAVIREWVDISFDEFIKHVNAWSSDLQLEFVWWDVEKKALRNILPTDVGKHLPKYRPPYGLSLILKRLYPDAKKVQSKMRDVLFEVLINGRPLPRSIALHALQMIENGVLKSKHNSIDHVLMSLLALYLRRNEMVDTSPTGEKVPASWSSEFARHSQGYALGAFLYVCAVAQKPKRPYDATIVSQFWKMLRLRPRRAYNMCRDMYRYYIRRLRLHNQQFIAIRLENESEFKACIGDLPDRLSETERIRFFLGFDQMRNHLRRNTKEQSNGEEKVATS